MTQNTVQIVGKTIVGIFSSKNQAHIIFASLGERGRRGSFGGWKSHCDFDIRTVETWEYLKGRGEERK